MHHIHLNAALFLSNPKLCSTGTNLQKHEHEICNNLKNPELRILLTSPPCSSYYWVRKKKSTLEKTSTKTKIFNLSHTWFAGWCFRNVIMQKLPRRFKILYIQLLKTKLDSYAFIRTKLYTQRTSSQNRGTRIFSLSHTHFNALSVPNEWNLIRSSRRYYRGSMRGHLGKQKVLFPQNTLAPYYIGLCWPLASFSGQAQNPTANEKTITHIHTSIQNGAQALTQHPRTLSVTHFHCLIYFCVSS